MNDLKITINRKPLTAAQISVVRQALSAYTVRLSENVELFRNNPKVQAIFQEERQRLHEVLKLVE